MFILANDTMDLVIDITVRVLSIISVAFQFFTSDFPKCALYKYMTKQKVSSPPNDTLACIDFI